MSEENSRTEKLKPYYVYALVDTTDGKDEIFYIGKGSNGRCDDHLREAINSHRTSSKLERIRKCLSTHNFKRVIISRHDEESEAFAVEAVLIKWVYGPSLTNDVQGHGHEFVRANGNFNLLIPGLEIEKFYSSGEFKNRKLEELKTSGAYTYRDKLITYLRECGFSISDFSTDFKKYDPKESNGHIGFVVSLNFLDIVVYFTKSQKLKVYVPTCNDITLEIKSFLASGDLKLTNPKNNNLYYRLLRNDEELSFTGSDALVDFFRELESLLSLRKTA